MSSPIHPEPQAPLSLDELRKKRATAYDWDHPLPIATTVNVTDRGPQGCLFQKPNRFALDTDEQMIGLSPVQAWMFATTMVGAWFGLQVSFTPFAVPGMPQQPNGQAGPASAPSSGTSGTPNPA